VKNAKPIFATMAAAVVAILTSSAAHADLQYDPNWPRVKCRLQGQSFQWNPNGAPSYQSAAAKCATFGGVDDRPAITNPRGTGVIKKEPVKVRQTQRK
jgi:hypothetical protein